MHYGMVRVLRVLDASDKFPHCHSGNQKGCHLCPGIGVVKWPLMRTSGPTPSHSGYQGSPRSSWWPPGRSLVPCVGGCGLGKQEGEVSDIVLGIGVGVVGNNVRPFTNARGFVWRHSWTSPRSLSVVISLCFWSAAPVPLLPLLYGPGLTVPMVLPHTIRECPVRP